MALLIADNILPLYSFEHVVLLLSQLVAGTVRRRLSGQPHLHFIIQAAGGEHRQARVRLQHVHHAIIVARRQSDYRLRLLRSGWRSGRARRNLSSPCPR